MDIKTFRSSLYSYIILGFFPWGIFSCIFLYDILFIHTKGAVPMFLSVAFALVAVFVWLKGFKLTITETELTYRDGMYKLHSIKISDIKTAKTTFIQFENLPGASIPRFVIKSVDRKAKPIEINIKPFTADAVNALNALKK